MGATTLSTMLVPLGVVLPAATGVLAALVLGAFAWAAAPDLLGTARAVFIATWARAAALPGSGMQARRPLWR